jgi:hypothetical protein
MADISPMYEEEIRVLWEDKKDEGHEAETATRFKASLRAVSSLKSSRFTNRKEQYMALVHHYVCTELANPDNYKYIPQKHILNLKFWRHFTIWPVRLFSNTHVQFILAICLMWQLHYYSHILYTSEPTPFMKKTLHIHESCASFPLQWPCAPLNEIQRYCFSGVQDVGKLVMMFFMKFVVNASLKFTGLISRYQS